MISICNNGGDILSTNYYESAAAKAGFCFLSGNAGTLRLLVPESVKHYIAEIRTGKKVVIEKSLMNHRCIDIVFEDGSNQPFFITLDKRQTMNIGGRGRNVDFSVWTLMGKHFTAKADVL